MRGDWYDARRVWVIGKYGYWVGGSTDRYSVSLGNVGGAPLRVERNTAPVEFAPQEYRDVSEARRIRSTPGQAQTTALSRSKPPFVDVETDLDGRVWVRVPANARKHTLAEKQMSRQVWIQDVLFDVYQRDGTYLGIVILPPGAWFVDATGDQVWATAQGELGEQYLIRYTLVGARER